jgi:hypothetical protein
MCLCTRTRNSWLDEAATNYFFFQIKLFVSGNIGNKTLLTKKLRKFVFFSIFGRKFAAKNKNSGEKSKKSKILTLKNRAQVLEIRTERDVLCSAGNWHHGQLVMWKMEMCVCGNNT